jgi:hypothetical protein
MVGSISLASEVSLLLLVPTFPAKTQIKCAKEIVRYQRKLAPHVGRETIRILQNHELKPWREKKLVRRGPK